MTLFDDSVDPRRASAPLALRMRPTSLDELVGHESLLGPGAPLRRLIEGGTGTVSLILWGPPGTGKTTLAMLVSTSSGRRFAELSAVTAGVKDVREVIEKARDELAVHGRGTVLFVDEVHRFSKTQQDALLPAVENGWVTLIAATTENPSFAVVGPLLSRSIMLALAPLSARDLELVIGRALVSPFGLAGEVILDDGARAHLVRIAGGDARRALTALEAAVAASNRGADGKYLVDLSTIEQAVQRAAVRYDRDGDQHYDVISAFIKSVRGSDVDAALHYLARMVVAGEDPRFIARRLVILASEDIGMADPTALQTATAALGAVTSVGLPEARLTLAQAVIHLSLAPKSNSVYRAIGAAIRDVEQGGIGTVPPHLRDASYPGATALGHGRSYRYPHDLPTGVAEQQYAPDELVGRRYFEPSAHGAEARWAEVLMRIREQLGGADQGGPSTD